MKLFELVIVAGVVAILAGAVSMPLIIGMDLWKISVITEVRLPEFHAAMNRITREMTFMEKDSMSMVDTEDIIFNSGLGGSTLMLIEWGSAERTLYINNEPLYGPDDSLDETSWGAEAFAIRPYDINNVEWTGFPLDPGGVPPFFQNSVWYFRIDITIGNGTDTYSYTRYVHPRNYLWSERVYDVEA